MYNSFHYFHFNAQLYCQVGSVHANLLHTGVNLVYLITLNLSDAKIIHVMKNISQIFPSKQGKASKKNAIDVVYTIEVIINIYLTIIYLLQ